MFLHVDERWNNSRSYLLEKLGQPLTTFIFGLIISIVCPVLFLFQNILLGMCLSEESITNFAHALRHVVRSLRVQLFVLYDFTLFNKKGNIGKSHSWSDIGRLLLGYTLYVMPLFGFGTLLMFGKFNVMLCLPLNAKFLVDNEVVPSVNMSNLYQARQLFGIEKDLLDRDAGLYNGIRGDEGALVWDSGGYRKHQYWPFDNIADLIKQYNYIGVHDVCIYPKSDIYLDRVLPTRTPYLDWNDWKGIAIVANGYILKNNSGTDYYLFLNDML